MQIDIKSIPLTTKYFNKTPLCIPLLTIAFVLPQLLSGCDMKSQFITDLEAGYDTKKDDVGVSLAVEKYFPHGASITVVNEQLKRLNKDGFQIGEYNYEGARVWPTGELRPYSDEATKKNLQKIYPIGITGFTGQKTYETYYFIFTKTAAFNVTVKDGKVIKSSGSIWMSGI